MQMGTWGPLPSVLIMEVSLFSSVKCLMQCRLTYLVSKCFFICLLGAQVYIICSSGAQQVSKVFAS